MSRPPQPEALPVPSPADAGRSEVLTEAIRQTIIDAGGAIDFSRFMELALYAPGLGYYASNAQQFGAGGDFITAPELSPLFGRCLARQCADVLAEIGGGRILEAGAGSGRLCTTILSALEGVGHLPERYLILELSAALRVEQQARIETELPHLKERVQWLTELPQGEFRGVVLANELLDALPVEIFEVTPDGITQRQVRIAGDGFGWTTRVADPVVAARVESLALAPGYVSEVGVIAEAWVRSIAERLRRDALLFVDYGFPRQEFYHPQRTAGTLMCHFRHRAHDDPLRWPGLQDITAHVDFTAIAEAGAAAGLSCLGFTSQAAFLLGNGLEQDVPDDPQARQAWAMQVRTLTLPHEMGEFFKVMALGRGVEQPLRGFAITDRRGRL